MWSHKILRQFSKGARFRHSSRYAKVDLQVTSFEHAHLTELSLACHGEEIQRKDQEVHQEDEWGISTDGEVGC